MADYIQSALGDCSFSGSEKKLVMLGVPRNTLKTTNVSEATPVAVLTKNPNAKILLDGFRHSISKLRLRAIRRKLERDVVLDQKYGTMAWKPMFREDIWNAAEIRITAATDLGVRESSIATAGVDSSATSQHFDLIIPDDLVNEINSRTQDSRERVYEHLMDHMAILNPGGVILMVFTFWHVNDAYARIIKLDEARERRGERPLWRKMIRSCYDGPNGLYCPTRLSYEHLEEQRELIGPYRFAANYLMKPIADEDKTFNMDALKMRPFKFFSTAEQSFGGVIRTENDAQYIVETTIAWDPMGRKVRSTSDSHGITVVATDVDDRWWIPEALSIKTTPESIINRMCLLIQIYRPWTVSIEDVVGQGLWLDMLADECVRRGIGVGFTEFATGGIPKEQRIILLQPRWARGGMILRSKPDAPDEPMHKEFYNQLDTFSPGGIDHEDVLDSLVQHLRLTRRPDIRALPRGESNPVDPEYAAFRKRQQQDDPGMPLTGRFGTTWTP
jgi:hypothetical protein